MADKVQPGDPLKISASAWNKMLDASEDYSRRRLGEGIDALRYSVHAIKIKNSSGANRVAGAVLDLNDDLLTTPDNDHLWFDGIAPTGGSRFAILKRPLPSGDIGDAIVLGSVIARVNVGNTSHLFAKPTSGSYVLTSDAAGPVKILNVPSSTGEQDCSVVVTGGGGGASLVAKNGGSAISARSGTTAGSGTVTPYKLVGTTLTSLGFTLTAYNLTDNTVAANAYIFVNQDVYGTWWVTVEDC